MTFPCIKCGMCCKKAGTVDKTLDRGDGACIYLKEDSLCSIYENRPKICRVDEMKPEGLTLPQWHEINIQICKSLGAKI